MELMHFLRAIFLSFLIGGVSQVSGQSLKMPERFSTDSVHFDLQNGYYAPIYMQLKSGPAFGTGIRMPEKIVIPARDTLYNFLAIPRALCRDTSQFERENFFTTGQSLGDPSNSVHDDKVQYTLPFPPGKGYPILQGWNGRFSHRSHQSRYALDFEMPIGDTVCAARDGIVVRMIDKYTENGGPEYRTKANQVVILHEDGTLAFYVHLDHKGVFVVPGDAVCAGQPVGLSGNTGFSTKPHLHFVVREAPDRAVPVYFEDYPRKKLKQGRTYFRKR